MEHRDTEADVYQPSFDLPPVPRSGSRSTVRTPSASRLQPEPISPAGYQIVEEIGRGGMAVVYQAKQLSLRRTVALKMLLSSSHLKTDDLLRFRSEADAVARLQHTNIVQIHEVGDCDGSPFLSLEFIPDGTLAQYLHGVPQSPHESAQLLEKLARAMHFAHQQGVVHRDLKPSNILLQAERQPASRGVVDRLPLSSFVPKISDFGLAKRLDTDDSRTRTGVIMGTPSYMAPEQAQGTNKTVGPPVDIYALGAVLYELLTGRPPFRGETPLDTLQHVMTQEPVPPSRLQPGVARDVETICLKCLHKEPARRYASAADLADDLARYQGGEPIQARPTGRCERVGKWAKRRPAAAALLMLSVLSATVLAVGVFFYNRDLSKALTDAVAAEKATERINLDMQREAGLAAGEKGSSALAALWFANAARHGGEYPEAQYANRLRTKYWSRLAPTPTHVLPKMATNLRHMEFHPQGRYVQFVTYPSAGRWSGVWDQERNVLLTLPAPTEQTNSLTWSPDGKQLAIGLGLESQRGELRILSFPELQPVHQEVWPKPVVTLSYSPDGKHLAIGDAGGLSLLDVDVKQKRSATWPHPAAVVHITWSPDNTQLVTGCVDGNARVFQVVRGQEKPLFDPVPHVRSVVRPVKPLIVNHGKSLVTLVSKREVGLHDLGTGKRTQTVVSTDIYDVVSSNDQSRVAICGFREIELWDVTTGKVKRLPTKHRNSVLAGAFSPDGDTLATSSGDRTLCFWNVSQGELQQPGTSQLNEVTHLAYAPDGSSLAMCQRDGLVRVIALMSDLLAVQSVPVEARDTFVALDSAGKHFIPVGTNLTSGVLHPRVHDVRTGQAVSKELTTAGYVNGGTFSSNSRHVVLCGGGAKTAAEREWVRYKPEMQKGWVACWEWAEYRRTFPPVETTSEPLGVACSPDGSRIVVTCAAGDILVLDAKTGAVLHRLHHGSRTPEQTITRGWVSFSTDGTRFLTSGLGSHVTLWNAASNRPVTKLNHDQGCACAEFSPDGKYVVTASRDYKVGVWDAVTGKPAAPFLEHPDWAFTARMSPENRFVVTACRDHTAKIWDWQTGQHQSLQHDDEVFDATFTRDGRWVVTAGRDNTVRIWDARTARAVCPPIALPAWVYQVTVTPDNGSLVITGVGGHVHLIALKEFFDGWENAISPEDLLLLAEILSGQRISGQAIAVNLTTAEWLERWHEYGRSHLQREGLARTPADRRNWHRKQSESLEKGKLWQQTLPHLSALIEVSPADWDLRARRARALTELKRYGEVIEDMDVAIKLQPREEVLWRRRGVAHRLLNHHDLAIHDFTKAIELTPSQPTNWQNRGIAYYLMSRWEEALADFRKATELRPSYAEAWLNQGAVYFKQKKLKEAVAAYNKAIELQPENWRGWAGRADTYALQGELLKAAADGAKSLELRSKAPK